MNERREDATGAVPTDSAGPKKLTPREILEKKKEYEFDFEKLLDPYRQGGTKDVYMQRTMGTIVDFLLNKKRYPVEVAGAAILKVFLQLHAGQQFKGDQSYGSPGRELVTHIRQTCDQFNTVLQQRQMYQWMAENVFSSVAQWAAQETKRQLRPWWKRLFTKKPPIKVEDLDVSTQRT